LGCKNLPQDEIPAPGIVAGNESCLHGGHFKKGGKKIPTLNDANQPFLKESNKEKLAGLFIFFSAFFFVVLACYS
jgi:hypothetical protein